MRRFATSTPATGGDDVGKLAAICFRRPGSSADESTRGGNISRRGASSESTRSPLCIDYFQQIRRLEHHGYCAPPCLAAPRNCICSRNICKCICSTIQVSCYNLG